MSTELLLIVCRHRRAKNEDQIQKVDDFLNPVYAAPAPFECNIIHVCKEFRRYNSCVKRRGNSDFDSVRFRTLEGELVAANMR